MAEFLIAGGLGYLFGRGHLRKWQRFIDGYNQRIGHLSYNKVIEPLAFYGKVENGKKIYGEGVYAYLFGLPNVALPSLFRCLEIGLKHKYRENESNEPKLSAFELIEWAEEFLGKQKMLAHGFRFLRNLIQHEEVVIEEQDTLESIRHITKILNTLFQYSTATLTGNCQFCKSPYNISIGIRECYFGNTKIVSCVKCKRIKQHTILPSY